MVRSPDASDALQYLVNKPTAPIQERAHVAAVYPYSVACIAARMQEGMQKFFAVEAEYFHSFFLF